MKGAWPGRARSGETLDGCHCPLFPPSRPAWGLWLTSLWTPAVRNVDTMFACFRRPRKSEM